MHSETAQIYINACIREHAECASELVEALDNNTKVAFLGQRSVPLNDIDVCCVAEALRELREDSGLRVLNLEENSFGLQGMQAIMEALEANPGHIRELRLGRNNLKDQGAVVIGHTLSRDGCGVKVLDLSENGITKLGVIPIAAALQNPTCDLIELSFHNNKIEGDAAVFLGQAIRETQKLKHLHLGYNALRDSGAVHLSKSLPFSPCLSTLDLTANRIGRDGGEALASALMVPSCTVQRVNLRHNELDSDTIERFADVIFANTTLIQLFLGFMNPTPEAATKVLSSLCHNHSLLLLDIYGWKLPPNRALELITSIQQSDGSVAAIVTDACQPIAKQIDLGNLEREERDAHPIYVGPDDRDAYLATKSQRRFSRAQSRRQSRGSSRAHSRTRGDSRRRGGSQQPTPAAADGEAKETPRATSRHSARRASRTSSRRASRTSSQNDRGHHRHERRQSNGRAEAPVQASPAVRPPPQEQHEQPKATAQMNSPPRQIIPHPTAHTPVHTPAVSSAAAETKPTRTPSRHSAKTPSRKDASARRSAPQSARSGTPRDSVRRRSSDDMEIARLLDELDQSPCDPETARIIRAIVETILHKMHQQKALHRRDMSELSDRLEALERRPPASPSRPANRVAAAQAPAVHDTPMVNGYSPSRGDLPQSAINERNSFMADPVPFARGASGMGSSMGYFNQRGDSQAPHQRSISRTSELHERAVTPLVHPSEVQDMPPGVVHPNDEPGDDRPEETSLQRSASVQNYPPRIEPSPARDADPPRRKSVAQIF